MVPIRFRAYSKPKEVKGLEEVLDLFLKIDRPVKEGNRKGPTSGRSNIADRS